MDISISIIFPVFNEESRLEKAFSALGYFLNNDTFSNVEIIFVDDGSQDKSAEMINNFSFKYPIRLISYKENRGKGYAVRRGMLAANNDYCLMLDVDMSTDFKELEKMIPLIKQGISVIIGTRKVEGATMIRRQPWYRQKLGEGYTFIANIITGVWVSDYTCGFKCFSRGAVNKIFPLVVVDRWSYDVEILFLAKKLGFSIREVPVSWENDDNSRVRLFRDMFGSFIDLIKIRIKHR